MPTSIPSAITVARIKSGYSMRALAEKAGVHVATISHLEKEPRLVRPGTAYQICQALQMPFDDLFSIPLESTDQSQEV